MSARKFHNPRHGSLQFVPKRRSKPTMKNIKAFPADDVSSEPHLTAFNSYKVGMTHVIRSKEVRTKNKVLSKEIFEAVTILEAPPIIPIGIVGYKKTVSGLERTKICLVEELSQGVVRRMFKQKYKPGVIYEDKRKVKNGIADSDYMFLEAHSDVIRLLCHTEPESIKALHQKMADITEIQINGGTVAQKLLYAKELIAKGEVRISDVFAKGEMIDTIGVTKGKGFQGVVKRFGVTILPHKSNKGTRKVACIGPWHPSNVMRTVARAGQLGCNRRTQQNLRIYGIGNGLEKLVTDFDLTVKTINPMGGFVKYGLVKNDYIMVKGAVTGPTKRAITLRKTIHPRSIVPATIKFVDTSSKIGKGRFQTPEEKKEFYGINKEEINAQIN